MIIVNNVTVATCIVWGPRIGTYQQPSPRCCHARFVFCWLCRQQDPSADPNRTVPDAAYKAVLSLVRNDQYARYVDLIVVQRQLTVAVLEAQWWKQVCSNQDVAVGTCYRNDFVSRR